MSNQIEDLSTDDSVEATNRRNDWLIDMDNLPAQEHNWISRGVIMSCEGAGHPYHQASKRR